MAALAARLDADIRQGTDALIQLHGLAGQASGEVLDQLARHFARRMPVDEGRAALWGGAVAGALAGLKADIASGGLTLGGGLLAGGVLGALGALGAAGGRGSGSGRLAGRCARGCGSGPLAGRGGCAAGRGQCRCPATAVP